MKLGHFIVGALIGLAASLAAGQERAPAQNSGARTPDGGRAVAPEPRGKAAEPGPAAAGQPPVAPPMTLAELEQIALQCNPTLAQAAARAEAARGLCVQVGLYPNPVGGYVGSEIGNEGRAGQQGAFMSQELVTAGKLRLNRATAAGEVRQAEWALEAQRFRVLTDVRRSFYDVLIAQRTVDLAEQLFRISEQGVKSTEELMKAKEVARTDVLQARIEADTASVLLQRARNRGSAAWRNLAAVAGSPDMAPRPLAGNVEDDVPQLTWEEAIRGLWAHSPQLAGARAGVARAQAALSRECAGRIPNVDLQAAVQYDNATMDTFTSVQLGVPLPVHNRNQGNIRRAQAELASAQQEVRRVQLELQQRLAVAFEQFTNARFQVEKYTRDILPNAQASLKLVEAGYRQGEFSYLYLLTAQRTFFQTNLAYLDSLRELRTAMAVIEGNVLADSLQGNEGADRGVQQR